MKDERASVQGLGAIGQALILWQQPIALRALRGFGSFVSFVSFVHQHVNAAAQRIHGSRLLAVGYRKHNHINLWQNYGLVRANETQPLNSVASL